MAKHVTIISPPWYTKGRHIFMSNNLGIGYIASYLERAGVTVEVIDSVAIGINNYKEVSCKDNIFQVGLSYEDIIRNIPKHTDLITISVPFTAFSKISKELSAKIREAFPEKPIIIGGVHATINPEDALTDDVDFVIKGEGEIPLLEFINRKYPEKIKGFYFKKNLDVIDNGLADIVTNLDDIPFPARHLFPINEYMIRSPRGKRDKRTLSIITSRGCPYSCNFCSVPLLYSQRWRGRSPNNVLNEIKELVSKYNIEHIEFEDDNITLDKDRAKKIFEGISINFPNLTWSLSNGVRIDTLDKELIIKMKESGCTRLDLALESGDPNVLKAMNKKLSLNKVYEVVKFCKEAGINVAVYLIIGYPTETKKRFYNSINFALKLKRIHVKSFAIHVIMAYEKTALYELCKDKQYLMGEDDKYRYVFGESNINNQFVSIATEDFDEKEVLWRYRYAYRKLMPLQYYFELIYMPFRNLSDYIPKSIKKIINRIVYHA